MFGVGVGSSYSIGEDLLRAALARPPRPAGAVPWVFRDVVFQDLGLQNTGWKPSPISVLGVKSPHLQFWGPINYYVQTHILKHHIPELPSAAQASCRPRPRRRCGTWASGMSHVYTLHTNNTSHVSIIIHIYIYIYMYCIVYCVHIYIYIYIYIHMYTHIHYVYLLMMRRRCGMWASGRSDTTYIWSTVCVVCTYI